MKNIAKNSEDGAAAIEAMAAAWLAQRDDGLTSEEAAEFARWQQKDPRHAAAIARLESSWILLQQLRDFRPKARMHPDRDLLACPNRRKAQPFPMLAAAAFAALISLAAMLGWRHLAAKAKAEAAVQTYATTSGGYQRVTLADGSTMELNADTEVRVRYAPNERRVRLVRGEVQFTVAKNKARPFWVDANRVSMRAVGTAFDVRLNARQVELIVTEGRVQVEQSASATALPETSAKPLPVLVAGEGALISMVGATSPLQVERVAQVAIRDALAWQGPRLIFTDTPLAEVVMEFNHRNHVQLVLADPELDVLQIGGSFRPENVEAFVDLLNGSFGITSERRDADTIILHKTQMPPGLSRRH